MMRTLFYPSREEWKGLCRRPSVEKKELEKSVLHTLNEVKMYGDKAVLDFTEKYDGVIIKSLKIPIAEISQSENLVDEQ